MSNRQTRASRVQKQVEPVRPQEVKRALRNEMLPVQAVGPQAVYRRAEVNYSGLRPAHLLTLQRTVGNRMMQRKMGTAAQPGSRWSIVSSCHAHQFTRVAGAPIQAKDKRAEATTKEALEKTYGITIVKGDKDWSASDITDLHWALGKLSKSELAALKGYRFLRWSDRASRREHDPAYDPKGEEEAGLHEADLKKGLYQISMYDAAFDKATTMELQVGGKTVGGPQLIGRIGMLHEIGHAMQIADLRRNWNAYHAVWMERSELVAQFNTASPNGQARLRPKVAAVERQLTKLEKELDTTKDRTLTEFAKLAKGMKPVTEYAATSTVEAFAETYALYKLNPKGIELMKPELAAWLKKQGYLMGEK